jgi:hypothetical protein
VVVQSIHFGFHRLRAKRFPYAIYYKVIDSKAIVFRVLDYRRNPNKLREVFEEMGWAGTRPSKALLSKAEGRIARGGVSGEFGRYLAETPVFAVARTGLFRPTGLGGIRQSQTATKQKL